jgi:hypothetical protein
MIARPLAEVPKGLWDDPVNRVAAGQAEMHFLEFFDWNQLDFGAFRTTACGSTASTGSRTLRDVRP